MEYSISFLMYFFFEALRRTCKDYSSKIIALLFIIKVVLSIFQLTFKYMSQSYRVEGDVSGNYPSRDYQNQYHSINRSTNQRRISQDSYLTPSNFQNTQPHLVPKVVESGYIIGPPVAYTQQPSLPPNFQPFSPRKLMVDASNPSRDHSPIGSRIIYSPNPKVSISQLPSSSNVARQNIQTETRYVVNQQPSQYQLQASQPQQIQMVHQTQPQQIVQESVSRIQYERCVSECKNWQTKYNELYLKYMNATSNSHQTAETSSLKEQNYRLQQRIKQLQGKERQFYDRLQDHYSALVQKYKESTMKECMLLVDRYRLESKQNDR